MPRHLIIPTGMLIGAATLWAQKPPKQEAPPPNPPILVENPNGTLTAQKEPPKAAKAPKGLVIPKQVVIRFAITPQAPKH